MSTHDWSQAELKLLKRRADRLLRLHKSTSQTTQTMTQVVLLGVGNERLALLATSVNKIFAVPPITPLPQLPPWMPGITQIQGEMISVVHLGQWLGIATEQKPGCLVLASGTQGAIGLLADTTLGFDSIDEDAISQGMGRTALSGNRSVKAVTPHFISIIDIEHLLADERLIVDSKAISGMP